MDKMKNIIEFSYYVAPSSLVIATLIFYRYALGIESTILIGLLDISTLIGGYQQTEKL